MTWHPAPAVSRLTRFARDGSSVLAWERCPSTLRPAALYRIDFRTDAEARGVVARMLADAFPGGVLFSLARACRIQPVRLA